MKQTSLTRRLLACAAGLTIGVAGAFALASPAHATEDGPQTAHLRLPTAGLHGEPVCDTETGTWTITWAVTNSAEHFEATISELSAEVEGLEVGTVVPTGDEPVTGTQTVESGVESAELTVKVTWTWEVGGETWSRTVSVTDGGPLGECKRDEPPPTPPTDPEEPAPSEELGTWDFDCDVLTIELTNPYDDAIEFTFVPSTGDEQVVSIDGGETDTVEFPSSEGLTVDVLVGGESIVDPETPIEITSELWNEAGCDEGQGGELPATGSSTGLIALGAVVLLAVGGGLFLVARRRRVTFTA